MTNLLKASIRLHDFIRANAGTTKDWPLQISSDDPLVLETLDRLLRELRSEAIKSNSAALP